MRATPRWAVGLTFAVLIIPSGIPSQAQTTNELRPPASFESIADQNARSRALTTGSPHRGTILALVGVLKAGVHAPKPELV
jgi:hypothetical protein